MKNWKLTLVAAASVLGLQACDVTVHDKPAAGPAASAAPAPATAGEPACEPAPTASMEAATPAPATAAAPDAATVDGSTPSTDATIAAQTPPPATPDTGAMGASGTAGTASPGAPAPMAPADGVAAPTELARFLEENPVQSRDPQAAGGPSDAGKTGAAKAEGKADDAARRGKS
jgi:hypothetical protein